MAKLETKDQLASNWSLVFGPFLSLMNTPFSFEIWIGGDLRSI